MHLAFTLLTYCYIAHKKGAPMIIADKTNNIAIYTNDRRKQ
jgi:hypothetical protein